MIPSHLHSLLTFTLVFSSFSSLHAIQCAGDYEPCGTAVLAPLKHLPCCSEGFYCFTKGPYFSQCRPKEELSKTRQSLPIHPPNPPSSIKQPLCGLDYGVCAAGTDAHSSLKCCNPNFVCTPVPPLYWQCLPQHEKPHVHWGWFRLNVAGRTMFTYASHAIGNPVVAADKIDPRIWHGTSRCVAAALPRLGDHRTLFERHLRESFAHAVQLQFGGIGVRACGANISDLGLTLAAFPQVLRIHVVE